MDSSILVGIASVIVSIAAAYFTYKQSNLALKQYTLNYIEMENNDHSLKEARLWLLDINNTDDYIESFYSIKSFLLYKGVDSNLLNKLKHNQFPNDEIYEKYWDEFYNGYTKISTIVSYRIMSSEAIIDGALDEYTYFIIRNLEFQRDYSKLKKFIYATYKFNNYKESYSRKSFRAVLHKWKEDPPIIKSFWSCIKKDDWEKYYYKLKYDES